MVSRKEWYARVNAAWPAEVPELTADEATKAAKKLWRWGMGAQLHRPIRITSGNRSTWIRGGVLWVNPEQGHGRSGWDRFIHDLSHCMWWLANASDVKPHDRDHAKFELRMRKEVLRRGWLAGKLRPQPESAAPLDPKVTELIRVMSGIKRWRTKYRLAETKLKKLNRARVRLERSGAVLPAQP